MVEHIGNNWVECELDFTIFHVNYIPPSNIRLTRYVHCRNNVKNLFNTTILQRKTPFQINFTSLKFIQRFIWFDFTSTFLWAEEND